MSAPRQGGQEEMKALWGATHFHVECLDCDWGEPEMVACDQQLADQMMAKARRHARSHGHNVHVGRVMEGMYMGNPDGL